MVALKSTGNTPVIRSISADNKPQQDSPTVTSGNKTAKRTRNGIAKTELKLNLDLPGVSICLKTSDSRIILAIIFASVIY